MLLIPAQRQFAVLSSTAPLRWTRMPKQVALYLAAATAWTFASGFVAPPPTHGRSTWLACGGGPARRHPIYWIEECAPHNKTRETAARSARNLASFLTHKGRPISVSAPHIPCGRTDHTHPQKVWHPTTWRRLIGCATHMLPSARNSAKTQGMSRFCSIRAAAPAEGLSCAIE